MNRGKRVATGALVVGIAAAGGGTLVARSASAGQSIQQVTRGNTVFYYSHEQ